MSSPITIPYKAVSLLNFYLEFSKIGQKNRLNTKYNFHLFFFSSIYLLNLMI